MVHIILYYNFKIIDHPERFCIEQRAKCKALGLLGRIYIAQEGINGTLAGSPEAIAAYKEFLLSLPRFADTEFKDDSSASMPFVKLIVRTRPEIVALKSTMPIDPTQEKGRHLSPGEWRTTIESEEVTLLDVRNNYESEIGRFEGALRPDIENFYEFENWLNDSGLDKGKKFLMYCTGGIRCEKFSLLMEKKGFKQVFQLHGGILNYKKEEGGAHFKGRCFVFDDRLSVPVNDEEGPLSRCAVTGVACDQYLNCANPDCNKLFVCSEEGAKKFEGCCSPECFGARRRRPFDAANIYEPTRKWHTYVSKNN